MTAGDITDALVSELSLIMEDPDAVRFPSATLLVFMNKAQKQLCNLLHNAYLTELESIETDVDASGESVAFSDLTYDVLRGAKGIIRVSVDKGGAGNDLWATELNVSDLKRVENTYLAATDEGPRYYIFNSTIYILMNTYTATTATVYYMKMPAEMTTDVDPEINEALYGLMLTLAEARLWGMDKQLERRTTALDLALREIEILNSRYRPAQGVGTVNRQIVEGATKET